MIELALKNLPPISSYKAFLAVLPVSSARWVAFTGRYYLRKWKDDFELKFILIIIRPTLLFLQSSKYQSRDNDDGGDDDDDDGGDDDDDDDDDKCVKWVEFLEPSG